VSLDRRTFLLRVAGGTACAACGCGRNFAFGDGGTDPSVADPCDAGSIIEVLPDPVNGMLVLPFTDFPVLNDDGGWVRGIPPAWGHPVIVIRHAGAYVALAAACTHLACGVNYACDLDLLLCPCHGSEFTLAGAVVRGPAELPLAVYAVSADATAVRVVLA
jgi:Rieske Fe-S protein